VAQYLDAAANPIGMTFTLADAAHGDERSPSLCGLGDQQRFIAFWSSGGGDVASSAPQIRMAALDGKGHYLSTGLACEQTEFPMAPTIGDEQYRPAAAVQDGSDGAIAVAWNQRTPGQPLHLKTAVVPAASLFPVP
jgi:hypothetical protein